MPVIINGSTGIDKIQDGTIVNADFNSSVTLGGPSLGTDAIIRTNADSIGENISIPSGTNGFSAGPITVDTNYTVTVLGTWTIV
jgi:hypothetical protein